VTGGVRRCAPTTAAVLQVDLGSARVKRFVVSTPARARGRESDTREFNISEREAALHHGGVLVGAAFVEERTEYRSLTYFDGRGTRNSCSSTAARDSHINPC